MDGRRSEESLDSGEKIMKIIDMNIVVVTEDDGVQIMSLSDDDNDPKHYIILQRDVDSNSDEENLGLDGCYVESTEFDDAGYDLISGYRLEGSKLTFQGAISPVQDILSINLLLSDEKISLVENTLSKLFRPKKKLP